MAQRLICDSNRCAAELVGCSLASDERHRSLNRNASSASSDPAKRAASPQPCNTSEPDRQVRHRSACHNQRALPESGIPLFELVNSSFVSNLDGGQKKKLTLHFERAQCGSWLIVGRMHRFTLQLSSKDFFSFFGPKLQLKNVTFVVGTIFLCEGVLELFIFSRLRPREGSGWIVAGAIATILMAFIVWCLWPFSSMRLLGGIVSTKFVISGLSRLMYSMATHKKLEAIAQGKELLA